MDYLNQISGEIYKFIINQVSWTDHFYHAIPTFDSWTLIKVKSLDTPNMRKTFEDRQICHLEKYHTLYSHPPTTYIIYKVIKSRNTRKQHFLSFYSHFIPANQIGGSELGQDMWQSTLLKLWFPSPFTVPSISNQNILWSTSFRSHNLLTPLGICTSCP